MNIISKINNFYRPQGSNGQRHISGSKVLITLLALSAIAIVGVQYSGMYDVFTPIQKAMTMEIPFGIGTMTGWKVAAIASSIVTLGYGIKLAVFRDKKADALLKAESTQEKIRKSKKEGMNRIAIEVIKEVQQAQSRTHQLVVENLSVREEDSSTHAETSNYVKQTMTDFFNAEEDITDGTVKEKINYFENASSKSEMTVVERSAEDITLAHFGLEFDSAAPYTVLSRAITETTEGLITVSRHTIIVLDAKERRFIDMGSMDPQEAQKKAQAMAQGQLPEQPPFRPEWLDQMHKKIDREDKEILKLIGGNLDRFSPYDVLPVKYNGVFGFIIVLDPKNNGFEWLPHATPERALRQAERLRKLEEDLYTRFFTA